MSESRKKPGVGFWATVVLAMGLVYVASLGPVIWLFDREVLPDSAAPAVRVVYWPLIYIMDADWHIGHWVQWYGELWMR